MFSDKDFHAWAKSGKAVMFAAVMTRIEGRENDNLLSTYEFRGFPSLAVLDGDGEALVKGVGRDLQGIIGTTEGAPEYVALKAKVDAGEKVDEAKWYMSRMRVGQMKLDEAKAGLKANELSPDDCAFAETQIFGMELMNVYRGSRGKGNPEAQEMVYKAFQAKRMLPKGSPIQGFYDEMLVKAAGEKKDRKAFFHSYEGVLKAKRDQIKAGDERMTRMKADLEKYKDNERLLPRIKRAIDSYETMLVDTKKDIIDLEMMAKEFGQKK